MRTPKNLKEIFRKVAVKNDIIPELLSEIRINGYFAVSSFDYEEHDPDGYINVRGVITVNIQTGDIFVNKIDYDILYTKKEYYFSDYTKISEVEKW